MFRRAVPNNELHHLNSTHTHLEQVADSVTYTATLQNGTANERHHSYARLTHVLVCSSRYHY